MKKFNFTIIIILMLCVKTTPMHGYDNKNAHKEINKTIIIEFKKRFTNYVKDYPEFKKFENYSVNLDITQIKGIEVTEPGDWYITESQGNYTPVDWIIHGGYSADEPEITASLRHFYDPEMNEKVLYLTNTGINPEYKNPCIDAIHWAFTGTDLEGNNKWTWNKGKEFMILGLEESDESKKEEFFGKAMRCLGEVLHNTADMGLPAHVRNDAHGGWWYFAGGNDPYESMFNPNWAQKMGAEKCDAELATNFRSSKTAVAINRRLAVFTNKYFFSHETISGQGVKQITSANGFKNYNTPKLEDFEYKPESFGYYKKFPSGREVKMCVDQSLFMGYISSNFRSFPRVDLSCVESQATELIPDIVEAGINVVRNFIPQLEINISANSNTGEISGTVYHLVDNEYTSSIGYSGEVSLLVNGKSKSIVLAKDGKFSGSIHGLKTGDKVVAKIYFADINVSSDEVKIDTKSLNLLNMGEFKLRAEIVWTPAARMGGYVRDQFSDWKFTPVNSTIGTGSLELKTPFSDGYHSIQVFNVKFNPSTQKVEKFTLKVTCQTGQTNDTKVKQEYEISLNGPADNQANWYTAGGCTLMYLNLTELQSSKVTYIDNRYVLKEQIKDSGIWEWVLDKTFTAKDLISSDGMGHVTSISFTSSTTK